mgnify:CR=1 FL=1
MKNVIWWPALVNPNHIDKYGGFDYYEYSRKSWEYWCEKNDVLFVPFENPVEKDFTRFRPQWQKCLYVFDELERLEIDYDQIALIDSSAIVRWDCPNFFELTNHEFTAWRDDDNLRWVHDSIEGYKNIFDGFELDITKYINSGFMIFNKKHKTFFKDLKNMYLEKQDDFIKLQDEVVRKGNDQTPVNYLLQMSGIDVKLDLPFTFNLRHINRKEMFNYNWQLKEDATPFFIKYCYVWRFTGLPKDQRSEVMAQTWDYVEKYYTFNKNELILNNVNHKDTFKNATSRKFKSDLLEFFKDKKYKEMSVLELGACQGDTTRVFAELFKKVYAVDRSEDNVRLIKEKCKDVQNVESSVMDVTNDEWKFPQVDVVFIDASHDYPQVKIDIQKVIDYFDNPIIILDDYGNPNNRNIRISIDEKINEGKINIHKLIGEDVGFKTKAGWEMIDREGVILC